MLEEHSGSAIAGPIQAEYSSKRVRSNPCLGRSHQHEMFGCSDAAAAVFLFIDRAFSTHLRGTESGLAALTASQASARICGREHVGSAGGSLRCLPCGSPGAASVMPDPDPDSNPYPNPNPLPRPDAQPKNPIGPTLTTCWSAGVDDFWEAVRGSETLQAPVPAERWDADGCYSAEQAPGKSYARFAAFVRVRCADWARLLLMLVCDIGLHTWCAFCGVC